MFYRPIPFNEPLDWQVRQSLYGASRLALATDAGKPGRNYLYSHREIDPITVATYKVGFVPEKVDNAFAGRIIFPIFDSYDELIAVSARPIFDFYCKSSGDNFLKSKLTNNEFCPCCGKKEYEKIPQKYWNESFAKGDHYYGLNVAAPYISLDNFVIITEGQLDVISLHSHGIRNVVGLMGSGFSDWRMIRIEEWTHNIILLFDGDKAGTQGEERARPILEQFHAILPTRSKQQVFKVGAVSLMDHEDPDGYVRQNGAEKMRALITGAAEKAEIKLSDRWQK